MSGKIDSGGRKDEQKILVVDDEQSIVTLLQYNLERSGYDVITASDGEEALELAENENPDLIVLDVIFAESGRNRRL